MATLIGKITDVTHKPPESLSSNESLPKLSGDLTAAENRITALENLLLLLHWDGMGTKPQLKPGWGIFNTTTGVIEKG